ncbi:hypothetical protein H4R18_001081 [Coemansia javaensis]|uniref:Phosphoglycerate mutase-like protein n=1 Tax=Coemansia javaensis TaxID=2761396 RepID=A0A9W8HJA7_9FUNG|nr:hypothetical protein H4R18_001081 [Coemansia javaensis]
MSQTEAAVELRAGNLTCYFVRHGERVDHVDESWAQTAPAPYDPPLTQEGRRQAQRTGALICRLEQEGEGAGAAQQTSYRILTSPFLRCAQTAEELYRGFRREECAQGSSSSKGSPWMVAVEPGLSEVLSENYFAQRPPDGIIAARRGEIAGGAVCDGMAHDDAYVAARDALPGYPEHFQDMMARFVATLDYVAGTLLAADGPRQVVVLVTHGAGINALLWATARQLRGSDVPYCCLSRARVVSRLPQQPSDAPRMPGHMWAVDYQAYSEHLFPRL